MKKESFFKKSLSKTEFNKLSYISEESIDLTFDEYINFINIVLGFYFPVKNFCSYTEYCKIIYSNLYNNSKWTIPILLSVKRSKFKVIKDSYYKLRFEGRHVGFIKAKNVFKVNKKIYSSLNLLLYRKICYKKRNNI